MGYQDNKVRFSNGRNCIIRDGSFTVRHSRIQSDQDPNHHLYSGLVVPFGLTGEMTFRLGRNLNDEVADWFNQTVKPNETTFGHTAGSLHFAMLGDLEINGQFLQFTDQPIVLSNIMLAQGKEWASNNWWFGQAGHGENDKASNRLWFDGAGQSFIFSFVRGGSGNDVNEIRLDIQDFTGGGSGDIGVDQNQSSDGGPDIPTDSGEPKPKNDPVITIAKASLAIGEQASGTRFNVRKVDPKNLEKLPFNIQSNLKPIKKDDLS